jgi:hypothetical protein
MLFLKILFNEISKIINIELFFTVLFIVLNILIILIITKKINKVKFDVRYKSQEEKRYLIPVIIFTSIFGFILILIATFSLVKN